ncbi:MAG: GAF and ANTAR domain-containing protein, partial [Salinibacterium sp.]|nr:GAF and ANTAR domain-containing protein [Salinibacterium sp.]
PRNTGVSRRLSQSESTQTVDVAALDSVPLGAGLCAPFVEQLPITGASISVFDMQGRQSTICASDPTAARLDELQFELGEGPQWDALERAMAVLHADVRGATPVASIPFGQALLPLPVGALFAFPMLLGAAAVGVVGLYRSSAGALDPEALQLAKSLTKHATIPAVSDAMRTAQTDADSANSTAPAMRREVHQATGILLVELGFSIEEAFAQLRAYAFATQRPIREVARDVLDRRLNFGELAD